MGEDAEAPGDATEGTVRARRQRVDASNAGAPQRTFDRGSVNIIGTSYAFMGFGRSRATLCQRRPTRASELRRAALHSSR